MNILVTGCLGFIGSNFVRSILKNYSDYKITNLDCLTYAGNPENLKDIVNNPSYKFIRGHIEDAALVKGLMKGIDCVVNFAAESHVDRSILNAQPFLITNVIGTHTMLEAARSASVQRFIHISTDEVYGALGDKGKFTEATPLSPNSPYSASKASGDLMVRAYHETYGFPAIIIRPSNNYGPYQFPEKLIPLAITNLIEDKPVPVYGKGENIRDWLFVEDCCAAIDLVLHKGREGEIYNIGGDGETKNIDIVRTLIKLMGKDKSYIHYVKDRPGHDYRYAIDYSKIERTLGWKPSLKIEDGLKATVKWYIDNPQWWKPLKERLKTESEGFWSESTRTGEK